jgi:hypothetical protein
MKNRQNNFPLKYECATSTSVFNMKVADGRVGNEVWKQSVKQTCSQRHKYYRRMTAVVVTSTHQPALSLTPSQTLRLTQFL